jgi:hypothetical protein
VRLKAKWEIQNGSSRPFNVSSFEKEPEQLVKLTVKFFYQPVKRKNRVMFKIQKQQLVEMH